MTMKKDMKYFTVNEANELIPRLRVLLGELSAIRQKWNSIYTGETIDSILEGKPPANQGNWLDITFTHKEELDQLKEDFYERVMEIQEMGCELKDIREGLVDFPAIRNSKVVYLCWKLGESSVKYWHDLKSGFAGRKPL